MIRARFLLPLLRALFSVDGSCRHLLLVESSQEQPHPKQPAPGTAAIHDSNRGEHILVAQFGCNATSDTGDEKALATCQPRCLRGGRDALRPVQPVIDLLLQVKIDVQQVVVAR